MYVRIVRGQLQSGQVDEMAKRWQEGVGANLPNLPGFRHGYFAGDRTTNTMIGVTLWDQMPDEAAMNQRMAEFAAKNQDIITRSPTSEVLEVLVEV
jgi:heme-degrading monooxygenase HmoA